MITKKIKSVNSTNRIESLDVLRGFALLGIALVNVFGFNASFFDFGGFYNNLPGPAQQKFYSFFIGLTADKFIFLYSFLFGYGFFLQLPNGLSSTCTECLTNALQIYPTNGNLACLKLRLFEYYSFRNINILYCLTKVLGIFFFGFIASKYTLHTRISGNRKTWFGIWQIWKPGAECNYMVCCRYFCFPVNV